MTTDIAKLGLEVDSSGLVKGRTELGKFDKSASATEKATTSLSGSFSGLNTAVGLAMAAVGGLSLSRVISEFASFQQVMLGVQAVSGATAKQMDELTSQARTLGATTVFSAQQAGEAQKFLAQAGFSVNEVMAATPGVLQLATAASLDLASAADIASNVLSGFRMPVQQLSRVTDVLAKTAASANTDVSQLGQALSFAAPIAAAAGISIEETAAAIGALSDAGLQGSRAGTGLVGVIRQLSNVTPNAQRALEKYGLSVDDVDLSTRSLQEVINTLSDANISVADSFVIFGSEAGSAAQILTGTADRVDELTKANRDAEGSAKAMADIMGSGLQASIKSLNSAVSEAVLRMGDTDGGLGRSMQFVIDSATGIISVYNGMLPQFAAANDLSQRQAQALTATAIALQSIAAGAATIGGLTLAIRGATAAQIAFNAAARANPYALLAAGAAALVTALIKVRQANEDLVDVFEHAATSSEAYEASQARLPELSREINKILEQRLALQQKMAALQESDSAEAQRRKARMSEEQLAEIEAFRLEQLKPLLEEENRLRERYHALTNARRDADMAETARIEEAKREEQAATLAAEKAAEAERERIAAERAAREAELAAIEAELRNAERASLATGVSNLKASYDRRYAIERKAQEDAKVAQQAYDAGVIESEQELSAILIMIEAKRIEDIAELNRIAQAQESAARMKAEMEAQASADRLVAIELKRVQMINAIRKSEFDTYSQFANATTNLMVELFGEQSAAARIAFLAQQGVQFASAIMSAEVASANTLAAYASLAAVSGPAAPAILAKGATMAGITKAMGYASAMAIAATNLSGYRESGGQVQPGSQYMVGERGPEILTMGAQGGHITPNHRINKGDGVSVTNVFQVSTGVAETVQAELMEMAPSMIEMSKQAIIQAINSGGAMTRAVGRRS